MTLLTFLRALENKIQRSEIQFPMEDLYFSLSHTNDIFLYLTTRLKLTTLHILFNISGSS